MSIFLLYVSLKSATALRIASFVSTNLESERIVTRSRAIHCAVLSSSFNRILKRLTISSGRARFQSNLAGRLHPACQGVDRRAEDDNSLRRGAGVWKEFADA